MEPVKTFAGKAVALPIDNIDTDQVIPAKYLKVTDKSGLGEGLFSVWRYNEDGSPNPDFVLNRPECAGATILVAGRNFGSGSSREHAPWALQDYGFKAVIAPSFADIFRGNALKIGLLPIAVDEEVYHQLVSMCEEDPSTTITIDLPNQKIVLEGNQEIGFNIDPFAKHCLMEGVDQLGFLLKEKDNVLSFEAKNPSRINTLAPAANARIY
jgi:3-isopropylmalate/(R)-2-methylmalate dehydratase small subunit